MSEIPADAARSEDGNWWWDGTAWQPVAGADGGDAVAADDSAERGEMTHAWGQSQVEEIDVPAMTEGSEEELA